MPDPACNPYLALTVQLAAGLDGIERKLQPGPRDDEPYAAERPLLPRSLEEALEALEKDALFRKQFGNLFVGYYLQLKRSELSRFKAWLDKNRASADEPTAWEQNEYFDFF
jgi:glutamine synthetase